MGHLTSDVCSQAPSGPHPPADRPRQSCMASEERDRVVDAVETSESLPEQARRPPPPPQRPAPCRVDLGGAGSPRGRPVRRPGRRIPASGVRLAEPVRQLRRSTGCSVAMFVGVATTRSRTRRRRRWSVGGGGLWRAPARRGLPLRRRRRRRRWALPGAGRRVVVRRVPTSRVAGGFAVTTWTTRRRCCMVGADECL